MRAVLIGGPFDGAEAWVEFVPPCIGVYACDGSCGSVPCAWKDALHWTDWRGGRKPCAVRYVLEEIADVGVTYVYGVGGDGPGEDWIAEELTIAAPLAAASRAPSRLSACVAL